MDRRQFLQSLVLGTGSIIMNKIGYGAEKSNSTFFNSSSLIEYKPNSLRFKLIESRQTGRKNRLEFFLNAHRSITIDGSNMGIESKVRSEIDFYLLRNRDGINNFYIEGLHNGKTFDDAIEDTLTKQKIVINQVLPKIQEIQIIRSLPSVEQRYKYAINNLSQLLKKTASAQIIAREIIGYQYVNLTGIEDGKAYDKMISLDYKLGIEEHIAESFFDSMRNLDQILYLNGNFNAISNKEQKKIRQYIDENLKLFQEYLNLHKIRGSAFVSNGIKSLNFNANKSKPILVSAGFNHYDEISKALELNSQVDFTIYAPTDLQIKKQSIDKKYQEQIKRINELKSYLKS